MRYTIEKFCHYTLLSTFGRANKIILFNDSDELVDAISSGILVD